MKCRDYQQACHDSVLAAWGVEPWYQEGDKWRSVLANLATSAGKTIIAAKIIQSLVDRGARCAFMADSDELCQQPLKKIREATGIYPTLEKAENRASPMAEVVVASCQTLAREARLRDFIGRYGRLDYIIVDEAHRGSPRNKKITDAFPDARILGLTATAFRANLKDLSDFYEYVAFELHAIDLMQQGYITPLKILSLPIAVDLSNVKQSTTAEGRDYDANELATTIEPYYRTVVQTIKDRAANRFIVAFHPLIASSKAFVDICQSEGINARHCDGTSSDREAVLEAFERGEFQVLSNANLFSTGVDFLRADCLLNLAPTRSVGLFRQRCGRILRTLKGVIDGLETADARRAAISASQKPDALILDLLWQTGKFNLVGPANVIANSQEEADAMSKKIRMARDPEDLANIRAETQADREREIIEAQERANKARQGKESLYSAESIGAMLHNENLIEYVPAMRWESSPISPKQRVALEKLGVDPDTVDNKGHAAAILTAVNDRQILNLAPVVAFPALKEKGVENPSACSLDEAIRLLRDRFPMPFGKHMGKPIGDIPEGYWNWMRGETGIMNYVRKTHPVVTRWMSYMNRQSFSSHQTEMQIVEPPPFENN